MPSFRSLARTLPILVACATAGVVAATQGPAPAQPGTAAVSGVVVDGNTGQPLAGAVVYLGDAPRPGVPMAPGSMHTRQITDARGRFVFTDLPRSDNLVVSASRAGYLNGGYSQNSAPGSSNVAFALAEGEWRSDVRVPLWRPGVIEGTVIDERGDPVVGVEVRTIALVRVAGRDHRAAGPIGTTDDRGRYRISGLPPGRYLVAVPSVQPSIHPTRTQADLNNMPEAMYATPLGRGRATMVPTLDTGGGTRVALGPYPVPPPPVDGQAFAYPLTFFPGAADINAATVIDIGFGTERSGADVRLAPRPAAQLNGRLEGPGQLGNLLVRLLSVEGLGFGYETALARTGVDGAFRFANVPYGAYLLEVAVQVNEYQAVAPGVMMGRGATPPGLGNFNMAIEMVRGAPPGTAFMSASSGSTSFSGRGPLSVTTDNSSALWARAPVSINAPQSPELLVQMRGSTTVSGRVEFDAPDAASASARNVAVAARMIRVVAEAADGSAGLGRPVTAFNMQNPPALDQDTSSMPFTIAGVLPGKYFLRSGLAQWTIKSITSGGRDYTDTPFDFTAASGANDVTIVVTQDAATISGTVRAAGGGPAGGARVGIFPVDRRLWVDFGMSPPRIAETAASPTGTYQIGSLPAGDYYVVVIPEAQAATWRGEDFFAAASAGAAHVSVDWGETRTHNLRTEVP